MAPKRHSLIVAESGWTGNGGARVPVHRPSQANLAAAHDTYWIVVYGTAARPRWSRNIPGVPSRAEKPI
eukprot:1675935-Pyramimonas_sp.AAC.1